MPWRGPQYPGELPTLGYIALSFMTELLAAPDSIEYKPYTPTREQAQFLLNFYALDPETGRRIYRRGVYSRPKGSGKSPFLSAIGIFEALGDAVPAGWDANGEPVGKPWRSLRTPIVQVAATSDEQTKNAWDPLLEMVRNGYLMDAFPGLEPMETAVMLPYSGRINPITSSATTQEGAKPIFAVLDQTESWTTSNGGIRFADAVRRNLTKTGGTSIEAPNAYLPGLGSVAEKTANYAEHLREKKFSMLAEGLLYDHREAPADTKLDDRTSLRKGLIYAYGDSAKENGGWIDLDRIEAEAFDPDVDPQDYRRYFLNQVTHASDAWLTGPEWQARLDQEKSISDKDAIVLGFDGSRKRERGVTDSTVIVACRVSDGHLFQEPGWSWEQPEGPTGKGWWVPTFEVDATIRDIFRKYNVVGFYADPAADWRSYVAGWEADFNDRLQLKRTRQHPIEWWFGGTNARQTVRALEQFHSAIVNGEMSHDGSGVLTRHILNARNDARTTGLHIRKPHPTSPLKIDAAVAATLAWQARLDAVAAGIMNERPASKGYTF